jgi:hypothetical protein
MTTVSELIIEFNSKQQVNYYTYQQLLEKIQLVLISWLGFKFLVHYTQYVDMSMIVNLLLFNSKLTHIP